MKKLILFSFVTLFLTSCSIVGIQSEEQPNYEVMFKYGKKEIRVYKTYITAETTLTGSFKEAQSKGFKILADYIFGNNTAKAKIAMTSPVYMKESPIKNTWTMIFAMPSKYNLDTLPKPNNDKVIIKKVNTKYMVALKYSGFWSEKKNLKNYNELLTWMNKSEKYNALQGLIFAGYNPPWTLPFFRRNEVLVELEVIE